MRIKMLTLAAGPAGVKHPGEIYDVDAKEGKALIEGRYAEYVDQPKTEPRSIASDLPDGVKDLGGGWFELPNGEKVQGKGNVSAAYEDMLKTQAEKQEQEKKLLELRAEATTLGIENADEKDAEVLLEEIAAKKSE